MLTDRADAPQTVDSGKALPMQAPGSGSTQSPALPTGPAQAWLAAIVESSEDAIISKTLDGLITSWNKGAERLFGYLAEEAIGQPITLIIPADRHDEEKAILQRLRAGKRIDHFETIRRTKDGRFLDISLSVSPVCDGTGNIVGASKVARDITVQKLAEAALRDADRRKDDFLAILSHELRNPLAPVIHSAEVLLRDHALSEGSRQMATIVQRQARYMSRLIDDLLDSSRISTGKIRLQKSWVDADAIIAIAVEINRPLIDKQQIRLGIDVPPGIPLYVDRDRVIQVLSNLLNNAAKYTEPGGSIDVQAESHGGSLSIRVRDSGAGIEADQLKSIFDLFTQGKPGRARAQTGLGIGLNVARKLIELHDGTITATSPGLGRGSEFIITLPLPSSSPVYPGEALVHGDVRSRRILIVDDNEDAAQAISCLLRLDGHKTAVAYDGLAAVEAAAGFKPHVVLLDLGLPKLSGENVARRFREELGDEILLVAMTGWGAEKDRQLTREAGFDHHLTKPVLIEDIESILNPGKP